MNTPTYHPQNGWADRKNESDAQRYVEKLCIRLGESCGDQLRLAEFAYNNSYHSCIQMEPFKALYGRSCRSPICWEEVGERRLLGPELAQDNHKGPFGK